MFYLMLQQETRDVWSVLQCDLALSAGNCLHQHPFDLNPLATHTATTVQPRFPRRNVDVPGANYLAPIVPAHFGLIHPLYFYQGNPNMFPHRGYYIQGECKIQPANMVFFCPLDIVCLVSFPYVSG